MTKKQLLARSKGGLARAKKYSHEELSAMSRGNGGGRPRLKTYAEIAGSEIKRKENNHLSEPARPESLTRLLNDFRHYETLAG